MKKIKYSLITLVMAIIVLFSSINVFALTQDELQDYVNKQKGLGKISSENAKLVNDSPDQIKVTIGDIDYFISPAGVEEAEAHLAKIAEDEAKTDSISDEIDIIDGGNKFRPDLQIIMDAIMGFVPVINGLLGLLVWIIVAGMAVFTATDMCYIQFPMFRGKCDDAKHENSKAFNIFDKIVSDEARHSLRAAETVETGKNPLVIYFGKRVLSYIILSIAVVILLTGNITIITDIAVKGAEGILKIIQRMAS